MKTAVFMLGVIVLMSACTLPDRSKRLTGRQVKMAAVQVDERWGYIDGTGRMVIKPQFDEGASFSEGLARVRVGNNESGRYGFIDMAGKFVLEHRFEEAGNCSNGLIAVKLGCAENWTGPDTGCQGYVDKTGKMIIPPVFETATDFSEGLAFVWCPGSGCVPVAGVCFIDKKGKEVIDEYLYGSMSHRFSEGFCPSCVWPENGVLRKHGFMDKTGRLVVEPQFDGVGNFSEGLAAVVKDHMVGFVDKNGKVVIEIRFPYSDFPPIFFPSFSEGLAGVCSDDGKYGFIDKTGQFVIEPKFDDVWPFLHGLAVVKVGDKWGYIDRTGGFVFKPVCEEIQKKQEDSLFAVSVNLYPFEKDAKWGYRTYDKKVIIKPRFDKAEEFEENLARVVVDGKQGLIDEKGNYVVKPEFDEISSSFTEGFAAVRMKGKWGFIDRTGKVVTKPRFDEVENFSDGMALVYDGESGLRGFINATGKLIIKPQYEQADSFSDGLAAVWIEDKWGYIDKKGKVAIQPRFEEAGQFSGWMARVCIYNEEGFLDEFLIDRSGKVKWKFQE
jgi:hypothetical protein